VHDVLRGDAAVVVDELADSVTMARVAEEMAPHIEATPYGSDGFSGRTTKRTGALIARSPSSHALVQHPLVLDVTGRLLHQAKSYQLHLTQTIAIGPDSPGQAIHRNQWAFDFFPFPADHHVQCNTIWALTDFTEANGATRIIPGSHLRDHSPEFGSHHDSIAAEMPRGSVLVWHGSLWHGGGANRTGERRVGIAMNYCAGWIRQQENQQLGIPREIARGFSARLRELVGYGVYHGLVGHIDKRDPKFLLGGTSSDGGMIWDLYSGKA
jgi:ectoine hydroxylase-related dioxygenase (phytanoyl-CoA dioxygenase family)